MKEKFSFREMLCYAFGDVGCNFIWTTVGSFLMLYYTNSVGISAAATGTLMLGGSIALHEITICSFYV